MIWLMKIYGPPTEEWHGLLREIKIDSRNPLTMQLNCIKLSLTVRESKFISVTGNSYGKEVKSNDHE